MPPERLNGGAIRGSLPTACNDMFWLCLHIERAANSRPYGTDERFPVGAIAESPAIMAQFGKRAVEDAGHYGFVSSSRVWVKP